MLEAKKKKLSGIVTAEENMKCGNITEDDYKIILEVLEQAKHNLGREVMVIEQGLKDDSDYRESYRR